ncbi:MAG: hypothetical protein NTW86_28190 [Candidatus Sumerlaeota bacterium]|nr:hypothetical protein [Candidatus Sumerlaeota bacterium]
MDFVTTFPQRPELEKARRKLERRDIPYQIIDAAPGYSRVGTGALATSAEGRFALGADLDLTDSGWVDYRPASRAIPARPPDSFPEDVFGTAAIMVLAPCVADLTRIRLIAHLSGNLTEVLPYLNAEMPNGFYNPNVPALTFMEGGRMVVVYASRITVAKAEELVDAWRTLEALRCLVNQTWARRNEIEPSALMRAKPPALEIFKRLPGSNCRACGEKTCMAFAVRLWCGELRASLCKPVFEGEHKHLKPALVEICAGLGVVTQDAESKPSGALED